MCRGQQEKVLAFNVFTRMVGIEGPSKQEMQLVLWGNKECQLLETKGDEFCDLSRKDVIIISTYEFPDGGWRRDIYLDMQNTVLIFKRPQRKMHHVLESLQWSMPKKKKTAQVDYLICPFSDLSPQDNISQFI